MTEKQFKSVKIDDELAYIVIDGFQCYVDTGDDVIIVNKLNELTEENELLKAVNGEYEDALARLEEENEQLKQAYTKLKQRHSLLHDENQKLECDKDEYYKDVLFLEKENRELKQLLSKTLREQYHLIKNEDKTGALVELKSIAAYLGVELE